MQRCRMSNDLNTALSDAIKQHLPEVAAKELRVYIERAEEIARKLKSTESVLETTRTDLLTARSSLRNQDVIDSDIANLRNGQAKLQEEKLILVYEKAELRAKIAEASLNANNHVVEMFLRLPSVRTSVHGNVHVPVEGHGNGNGYSVPGHVEERHQSTTTTVTHE